MNVKEKMNEIEARTKLEQYMLAGIEDEKKELMKIDDVLEFDKESAVAYAMLKSLREFMAKTQEMINEAKEELKK